MQIKKNLIDLLVEASQSINEALIKINQNKEKIIFIVSSSGKLLGSFSDGDLRRLLTSGEKFDLRDEISSVMNSSVVSFSSNKDPKNMKNLFKDGIEIIPIVDDHLRIKSIAINAGNGFEIDGVEINENNKTFVIAEIGNNHNGSLGSAKKLIDLAKESGADCAKFQMRDLEVLYKSGSENDDSADLGAQYTMDLLKQFQLKDEELFEAFDYCRSIGLPALCTPWDKSTLEKLEDYGMTAYKVASADLTNHDFLESLAATKKPLICSTGMSLEEEILKTINFLNSRGAIFALLHCNSTYPTPYKDINLSYIKRLKEISNKIIGYSGHERGISFPIAAVALGAKIVEKHFTIDKSLEGNDHKVSLLPNEFKEMVNEIRNIEDGLGSTDKRVLSQGEMINRDTLAKSLISNTNIKKGEKIKFESIEIKSPGQGLQPIYKDELVGRNANRDIKKGDYFYESDLLEASTQPKEYKFNRPFGIPVRFHDFNTLHKKSNFDFVEFHLSYQDMDLEISEYVENDQIIDFVVHSPELFKGDHILDLASLDKKYRDRSIKELNRVCDVTRSINKFFPQTQDPVIVLNAGGFSTNGFLKQDEKDELYSLVSDSLKQVNSESVKISIQTMPPYPWHFGGQSYHNLFLDPQEISDFCDKNKTYICLDISHTVMACNFYKWDLKSFIKKIAKYVSHLHISDAQGVDGEGVEMGFGDVNFESLFQILDENTPNISFIPEIWQGHKNDGEGFWKALEYLEKV